MKFKNLSLLLALVILFLTTVPANGYVDPFTRNEVRVQLGGDDHPWGGDCSFGPEDPTINPPQGVFIWVPLSFIDFFRMVPYLNVRNDIILIKGDGSQNDGTTILKTTTTNNIPNPEIKQRGY
ncbi:exported hypothetical protein [Candidatus Zixiibacteriota bacterium]|nr:exported hypothetical protein [candidate division Zixibacteria bacterium]